MSDRTAVDAPITRQAGGGEGIFGTGTLVTYYITNLVGAGILVIPAIALEAAGPWSILAWLVLCVCAWPMARVFASIAIDYPNSNGVLHFVGVMLGHRVRDALTLLLLLAMVVGNPVVALVAARYMLNCLGWGADMYYPTAVTIMLLNVGFNLVGLKMGSWLQRILLSLTMGVLVIALASAVPAADAARLTRIPFSLDGFLGALGVCFFTFLGWENVCTIAPNVRDGARSFKRAITIAVPLIGGLYMAIAVTLALTVPIETISGDYAVLNLLTNAGSSSQIAAGANFIGFLVVFLSGNAWVLAGGKLCSAAARDGLLPRSLARGTETTPRLAFLAMNGGYMLTILVLAAFGKTEAVLVEFVSATFICVYITAMYAALRFYPRHEVRYLALVSFLMISIFAGSVLLKVMLITLLAVGICVLLRFNSSECEDGSSRSS